MHLLKYFDKLSLQPENAKELRGLILDLAIRGRLTEEWRQENPDVESASILLRRINEERTRLIKEKVIRKEKSLSKINNEELNFRLPKMWEWTRLGNIGEVYNGNSISKSKKKSKYNHVEEGYSYLGTKDVGYGFEELNYDTGVTIPFDEPKFKVGKKGTVLICSEGGSAGKKCGITKYDICFGNKLYAISPFIQLEPIYILAFYLTKSFQQAFEESLTGIIGGISKTNFKDIPFPLPPLQEQKAIVKIVNQLMEEVDALESRTTRRAQLRQAFVESSLHELTTEKSQHAWTQLQPKFKSFFDTEESIDRFKEAILQLAIQGKLTKNWRSKNKKSTEKQQTPINFEGPVKIPKSWSWTYLKNLSSINGGFAFKSSKYIDNGVRVIRISDFDENGLKDAKIKRYEYSDELEKYELENQNILMAMTGGTVGKTYFVTSLSERMFVNQRVATIKLNEEVIPSYINFVLKTNLIQDVIHEVKNSTNDNISIGGIKNFKIPLPPLDEQKAIVQIVNQLMGYCNQMKTEIKNIDSLSHDFLQSSIREVIEQTEVVT